MRPEGYTKTMNLSIEALFREAVTLSVRNPSFALFLLETIARQRSAAQLRDRWEAAGVPVPPIMIASVTNLCNLHCKGCYNRAQHRATDLEMGAGDWRRVFTEARDLGIFIALLAGGEPLVRPEILDVAASIPEIIFPLFTNGLLLSDAVVTRLAGARNIVPVLSIERDEAETDERRGEGVYYHLREAMGRLHEAGVFFGVSLTVTSRNFEAVTDESFIRECIRAGSRLFFFVEYVPAKEGTEDLVLDDDQKGELLSVTASFRGRLPGLFVAFPGDEEEMGGCVAAGRGFVHVSAAGNLEPCPFSPYSDVSVRTTPHCSGAGNKAMIPPTMPRSIPPIPQCPLIVRPLLLFTAAEFRNCSGSPFIAAFRSTETPKRVPSPIYRCILHRWGRETHRTFPPMMRLPPLMHLAPVPLQVIRTWHTGANDDPGHRFTTTRLVPTHAGSPRR